MTVGVALKCRDSVVLACDSQATSGNYKDQATKLEKLDDYHGLVMAGAGNTCQDIANRVRDYLKSERGPNTRKIADITSNVMAGLYREYAARFGGTAMGDVITVANSMPSQLLIGGRDENEGPQIYIVNSPGVPGPVENYDTIGSGGFYAGTILKNEFFKDMHSDHGQFLAIRAVILASVMDPFVGEGFRLAAIHRPPNGYHDISHVVETRYKPLVKRVNGLRHDLDLILMGEAFEQEDSLARLLDTLGVFGLGPDKLSSLSQRAYELRQQEENLREDMLKHQEPRGQE